MEDRKKVLEIENQTDNKPNQIKTNPLVMFFTEHQFGSLFQKSIDLVWFLVDLKIDKTEPTITLLSRDEIHLHLAQT